MRLTPGGRVDVVAGTGRACLTTDQRRCGDGQLAVHAALSHPKGASSPRNNNARHHTSPPLLRKRDVIHKTGST